MNGHGVLGRQVAAPERYAPELLFAIPRTQPRSGIRVCWDAGADEWTGWELSWLEPGGMPAAAVLHLVVPADSPAIVESKSLKLYLNSLNATVFATTRELLDTLHRDLAACIGCPVQIELLAPDSALLLPQAHLPGDCLDLLLPAAIPDGVDAGRLQVDRGRNQAISVHTRLFRSCCPVTGQPDWASVCIDYAGPWLDPATLLAYLLGYRQHHGFHEQCVERIFADLQERTGSSQLRVSARFLRRGGLDINPWRSLGSGFGPLPLRELRQ